MCFFTQIFKGDFTVPVPFTGSGCVFLRLYVSGLELVSLFTRAIRIDKSIKRNSTFIRGMEWKEKGNVKKGAANMKGRDIEDGIQSRLVQSFSNEVRQAVGHLMREAASVTELA
jgi:hypothetical protein